MKNTYQFNFDDTTLTSKLEDIVYDLENINPETMTSAELVEFCKLDLLMQKIRNEVLNYAAAECIMHNSLND